MEDRTLEILEQLMQILGKQNFREEIDFLKPKRRTQSWQILPAYRCGRYINSSVLFLYHKQILKGLSCVIIVAILFPRGIS